MKKQQSSASNLGPVIAEQIGLAVRWLAVCTAIVLVAQSLEAILIAFAGKKTEANVFMSFLANVDANIFLAWGLAATGIVYGGAQKALRRKEIEASHGHVVELERQLDRRRSSSQLTPRGDTNPKDK